MNTFINFKSLLIFFFPFICMSCDAKKNTIITEGNVQASSSFGIEFNPSNAFDNDALTMWKAETGGESQWLWIDLEEEYYITKVQQLFEESSTWKFVIEGSLDNDQWLTLVDKSHGVPGQLFGESVSGIYRYIKLTVLGSTDGYPATSKEFTITGNKYGFNLAMGAKITSSSGTVKHYEPVKAIDNNTSTYWCAPHGNYPQSLTVDLGTEKYITAVQQTFNDYDLWKFKIEGSNDQANWQMLSDNRGGQSGCNFMDSVEDTYRYVRLTILGSSKGFWANSREFEIFGFEKESNSSHTYNRLRNLSVDVAVSASSVESYEASQYKAIDGNENTCWKAKSGDDFPQYLIFDLGNPCLIKELEQTFLNEDNWTFDIQGSNDKKEWTVVSEREQRNGKSFTMQTDNIFRYVKLTIYDSQQGSVASSQSFRIMGTGSPVTARWWENNSGITRYYCKLYDYKIKEIIEDLDNIKGQGYNILELSTPYEGKADIWAGLGATNNYAIDPSFGTMEEFEELISEAHKRDMRILFFGNVGYCRDEAPFFQKACEDQRNDVYSKERMWFNFSDKKHNENWFWSEKANAYYHSVWGNTDGAAGRIPSYNFNNQEWRDECKKYLQYWADKDVDGILLDAPEVYDGITDKITEEYITSVLLKYDMLAAAEGSSNIGKWFGNFGYNCVQGFDLYGWGGGKRSEAINALRNQDGSSLNSKLKEYRDYANALYGVTLTPPMWEVASTIEERLFETAYLTAVGTMFANHYGDKEYIGQDIIARWPRRDQDTYFNLVRTQSAYKGLAPSGSRIQLPSNDDTKFSVFKRTNKDGNVSALIFINFQNKTSEISVNLKNTGIQIPQTPINLHSGEEHTPITNETYVLTLPPYGYVMLAVENEISSGFVTNIGERVEDNLSMSVFPNPVIDKLYISLSKQIEKLDVYSITGKLIKEYVVKSTSSSFDMNFLLPGVYILNIVDINKNKYERKIIKR